jgi:hypothetical protein
VDRNALRREGARISFVPAPQSWRRPAGLHTRLCCSSRGGSQRRVTDAGIFTEEEGRLVAVAARGASGRPRSPRRAAPGREEADLVPAGHQRLSVTEWRRPGSTRWWRRSCALRQRAPAPPRRAQHRTGVRILEGGACDQPAGSRSVGVAGRSRTPVRTAALGSAWPSPGWLVSTTTGDQSVRPCRHSVQ